MSKIIFNQNELQCEELNKLINKISGLEIEDDSLKTQKKLVYLLKKMGFEVKCSFPSNERGDGKKGRINIIAYGLDKPIGFCIDKDHYRKKSITKLNSIPDIYRILILRKGNIKPLVTGIYAAISLNIKQNNKKMGIYTITNLINHKVYVGSSIDLDGRFNNHKYKLYNNQHDNKNLQKDWNEYGDINFSFDIIKIIQSELELPSEEKLLIEKLKETTSVYNISDPLEETHRGRFEKNKKVSKGFRKYSKQHIIEYLNQNFLDKMEILHDNISERKFYPKEVLDNWFKDNIDDPDIANDYRLELFLKAWYNKSKFSVLESRIWKSAFKKLYKKNIEGHKYILVTQEASSELYEAKFKTKNKF